MTSSVLIAAELRDLIGDDPVPGAAVEWIAAHEPTPAGNYVAVIPLLSRWIGGGELKRMPALRVVANCAAGLDNIDLVAAEMRGVMVTNTPFVLTDATADLTWALILAVARRLKEGAQLVRSGTWTGWHPTQLLGLELRGATLGIVGAGNIGQAVGRRAVGFGMAVRYVARRARPSFEAETGAVRADLRRLLEESDVVSLHLPATHETRGMFDRARLAMCRPGALLINTARGELVREPALIEALESGTIGGAGLDVFADEPVVSDALIAHPRVVTLPHLGSATDATRRAMAELAVRNVRAVLAGEDPPTPASC
ncbi:MAG TPA: D-glycerate dehydrogenase [Gemmatimonadales bacterium]